MDGLPRLGSQSQSRRNFSYKQSVLSVSTRDWSESDYLVFETAVSVKTLSFKKVLFVLLN